MKDEKAQHRADARMVRRAIVGPERDVKEARIAEAFGALPELRSAASVACYVGVRSEVSTKLILRALLARGVTVGVPVVVDHHMAFVRLQHPWSLKPGAYGIPEPRQPWESLDGATFNVIAVPGLRFGRDGGRLGNGGGHFDRFLAAHPEARRVGLAFDEQVVDTLPVEEHDEDLDVLITDKETFRMPRRVD